MMVVHALRLHSGPVHSVPNWQYPEQQLTKPVSGYSEGACDAAVCRIGMTLTMLSALIFLLPASLFLETQS